MMKLSGCFCGLKLLLHLTMWDKRDVIPKHGIGERKFVSLDRKKCAMEWQTKLRGLHQNYNR